MEGKRSSEQFMVTLNVEAKLSDETEIIYVLQ